VCELALPYRHLQRLSTSIDKRFTPESPYFTPVASSSVVFEQQVQRALGLRNPAPQRNVTIARTVHSAARTIGYLQITQVGT